MPRAQGACPPETVLAAFVAGSLTEEEVSPLEVHLSSCEDCRRVLDVIERTAVTFAPTTANVAPDPGASVLPAGTRAGRYLLRRLVGVGGMGQVFEAHDPELDRKVAIKILHARGTDDELERLAGRMRREAQTMAKLSHPNVVAVHDVGTVDGRVFVAMEYVEGSTLRRWLGTRRSSREILRILEQAGRGLAAAHAAGLVHRDFKPDNVLVGDDGRARVTDFGLAHALEAEAVPSSRRPTGAPRSDTLRAGVIAGTPAYMAPEAIDGGKVDARSDVFGFCVTAYEALNGVRPFRGRSVQELRQAVEAGKVRPGAGPDVAPAIRRAVLKGLRADPAERHPTLEPLLELLHRPPARSGGWIVAGVVGASVATAATLGISRHVLGSRASAEPAAVHDEQAPSRSSNAEAQRLYDAAMRSFHEGLGHEMPLLERAVQADPAFGGAYLRLSMLVQIEQYQLLNPDQSDAAAIAPFRTAVELRDTLSRRDQELMTFADSSNSNRDHTPELFERWDAYVARYPDDALAAVLRVLNAPWTEWEQRFGRLLEADPGLVPALALKAGVASRRDPAASMSAVDGCLRRNPLAAWCLRRRVALHSNANACGDALEDAEHWSLLQPESQEARDAVAALRAGQPGSLAMPPALESVDAGAGRVAPFGMFFREVSAPLALGDFQRVVSVALAQRERLASSTVAVDHGLVANALVVAYTESGDTRSAALVAQDYLDHRAAWPQYEAAYVAAMIRAAARGGLVTRARETALLDAEYRRLLTEYRGDALAAWAQIYAWEVDTPYDVATSLAVLDSFHGDLQLAERFRVEGALVLFLGGRGEQARPVLEQAVTSCMKALLNPPQRMHMHLALGELDEKEGAKASACSHFGVVLGHWGRARPRSVTADEARAHAVKLGCALED